MSNISRIIAKEVANSKGTNKVIKKYIFGYISPVTEWVKWLSYESEYEKNRMSYFSSKKVSDLSHLELEEASKYSKNRFFAELFKIYGTSECSYEDYMKVYDYISSKSIDELMISKLSREELQYAKEEISRLSKVSKKELNELIKSGKNKYESLSMVDSYILHMIANNNYSRSINNTNELNAETKRNEAIKQRSLYYASKSFVL